MQIHEITRRRRTDEGLLDSFKDAVGLTPQAPDSRTVMQKLRGEIPNKIDFDDPKNAKYAAQQKKYDAYQEKKRAEVDKYFTDKGYKTGDAAIADAEANKKSGRLQQAIQQAIQQVKADPATQTQIQGITQEFGQEYGVGLPSPGKVFNVEMNNSTYTKDEKGVWRNVHGEALKPENTKGLEQRLDAGAGKEVNAPPPPEPPKKGKQVAESLQEGRRSLAQEKFYAWVAPKIAGKGPDDQPITLAQIYQNPLVKQALNSAYKKIVDANNKNDTGGMKAAFQEFMTVAVAGKIVVGKKRSGANTTGDTPDDRAQNPGVVTGDPLTDKLSQEISPEGIEMLERNPDAGIKAIQNILNTNKRRRGY